MQTSPAGLRFHSRCLVGSVDRLALIESESFHRDKSGFFSQEHVPPCIVTAGVHAPGEREGGRHTGHPRPLVHFAAHARFRASEQLDSDYSRTGHQFFGCATSFVEDFRVSAFLETS